jgi:hypothetical protein
MLLAWVTAPSQQPSSVAPVHVTAVHAGTSIFMDAMQRQWSFQHHPYHDTSLEFLSNTAGCTPPQSPRPSCPNEQCALPFSLYVNAAFFVCALIAECPVCNYASAVV